MIYALLLTLYYVLDIVKWVFIVMIIMSWLIAFNVINTRNQFVSTVWRVLNQVTDPILKPIRRVVPYVGGLDLSPIILFVIIFFLQTLIGQYAGRAALGMI